MVDYLLLWVPSAICLLCVLRCHFPPRTVRGLLDRVAGLEDAYEAVAQRLTKRAKAENLEGARAERETKRDRQARIEEEALAILERDRAPGQGSLDLSTEAGRAAAKAQLRKLHMIGGQK